MCSIPMPQGTNAYDSALTAHCQEKLSYARCTTVRSGTHAAMQRESMPFAWTCLSRQYAVFRVTHPSLFADGQRRSCIFFGP